MVTEIIAANTLLQVFEFQNRSASPLEEVIALINYARILDLCIGFSGITGKLLGVIHHGSCFTIKTK